ncbi:TetR/AcrR family transcriptional regulator [Pseudoclavibacter chungangensis]|uniref:TetR/AcrR family transcriptional regulator n=1 Tax=Pseudoclavibacter chungangensis TaxID=587635 RepID=A0A7J5C0V5_9MICO|nr:TetR/AcrR family transcriptional regulator [Pseudoclavibacter chungangensis]KAB1662256.1 TetR/AcrR family transcriptional regulator [Pseudoclavibacter chungangensis]NYJ65462.1 AcrR family transcriptional regulator [Pseudoclavibacter chungangensis]
MFTEHVQSRAAKRASSSARVLEAAATLFAERGFAASTVRDIAAHAGVSVGTVMAVGDKDRLLLDVMEQRIEGLQRGAVPERGSLPERVLALLVPFVELFVADTELARAFAGVLVAGRHRSAVFGALGTELRERVATVARSTAAIGENEASAFAALVHDAYLGVLFAGAAAGPDVTGPEIARRLDAAVTTACRAIAVDR